MRYATWGLWRTSRHRPFSTCCSHSVKWLSPWDTPLDIVCDLWLSPAEHVYTKPNGRSQRTPLCYASKGCKGYPYLPGSDTFLGGGEKKLQTQTPTRKHQTGFQGWWPHHTTDHIMPLSKDIMAVSFPFSSLTHEPLKERTPVEETYTCAKSHL